MDKETQRRIRTLIESYSNRSMLDGMKRLVPILLIAILLPQVALASWWNPLSWKIFYKKDVKTEILNTKTAQSEDEGTQIDLTTLRTYIDYLINDYKANLEYVQSTLRNVDFYAEDFRKGRNLTITSRNNALNGFDDAWDLLISQWEEGLKTNAWNREVFVKMATHLSSVIADLQNKKMVFSGQVSEKQYLDEYNKLKKYYGDNVSQDTNLIRSQYKKFHSDADELREEIGNGMLFIAQKELDYVSSSRNEYNQDSLSLSKTQSYRPLSVPQIQMPKTTNCSIREMSGAKGILSIECNTY
jgi:hypothetical protein